MKNNESKQLIISLICYFITVIGLLYIYYYYSDKRLEYIQNNQELLINRTDTILTILQD